MVARTATPKPTKPAIRSLVPTAETVAATEEAQNMAVGQTPTAALPHHSTLDGDLDKLTAMVNACLGAKLAEPLTSVDVTAILLMQQVNNMQVDAFMGNTLAALNRICEVAQTASDTIQTD